jgi:hypothetical protein
MIFSQLSVVSCSLPQMAKSSLTRGTIDQETGTERSKRDAQENN